MFLSVPIGRRSSCSIARKVLNSAITGSFISGYSSIAAEIFIAHLNDDPVNIERSLNTVNAKVDARCITQVLENCAVSKPQLAARFFIWAGLHPTHRHTSFMYEKACNLLDIRMNPRVIQDVVDDYMAEGCFVSVKMVKLILNLCRAAKDADLSLWVLRKIKDFNCRPDTVCYNIVIRLLVEKGSLDEAMGLMREMGLIYLYPDNVSYVLIVKGLCDSGRLEAAFDLVKVMKEHGCVPNAVVYSTLLDGICSTGSSDTTAFEFLTEMENASGECKPNVVTYTGVIKSLADKGRAMEALNVLDRMADFKVKPNRVTFAALFDGLCREGHVEEACKVVDRFKGRGFHYDELFSVLIMSLLRVGKHWDFGKMLRMMVSQGMNPNGLASGRIIRAVVSNERVLDAFILFEALGESEYGIFVDSETCSALLVALFRENYFSEAAKVGKVMRDKGIHPTSSLAETVIQNLKAS